MADPIAINVQAAAKAAPAVYNVAGSTEIELLAGFATFDGTGAAGAFLPSIAFYSSGGLLITRTFPSTSVAAGASADVSFFPGVGAPSGSGGGTSGLTVQTPVILDTADSGGNGFIALSTGFGFSNIRRAQPALPHSVLGFWEGSCRIPQNYGSAGTVIVSLVANNTLGAGKAARVRVSTAVVASGVSEDTAYTDEAYVNVSVPATANQRFDQSYALTTTPAAGSTLNVKVTRDGASGSDTLVGINCLVWETVFQYTTA